MRRASFTAAIVLALTVAASEQGPATATAAEGSEDQQGKAQTAAQMRFRQMDTNGDGQISRAEWRGSAQSFRVHDWNGDGVLSGAEVREAVRQADTLDLGDYDSTAVFNDWSAARFAALDRNRDGRLTTAEWLYDLDTFRRVDRNRDNVIIRTEFLGGDFDDDRGDRFDFLDANGNNRVTRDEWHASPEAFTWLNANRDGVLTRAEVEGPANNQQGDLFARLDVNRNNRINPTEWQWSRASFDRLDVNRDGVLTRAEMGGAAKPGRDRVTLSVNPRNDTRWIDTGVQVFAGDRIRFQATGSIQMSPTAEDVADPAGSRTKRLAHDAPLPERLAGALIGRIDTGAPFFIGAVATPILMRQSGQLFLSMNDDYLDDNKGEFQVTVTVQRSTP